MKILLAGDSTVAEQARDDSNPGLRYCGWGQMMGRFFTDIKIINYAVSGYSVNDFREKGQYKKLLEALGKDDYALFQFGHNDQKRLELRAWDGYAVALRQYISEIRQQGGKPVMVTSAARNSWRGDNGNYLDLLAEYAEAMKHVAAEKNIPIIDLQGTSVAWIISLGRESAKKYFYPGDFTHPNDYGGYKWAGMVAELILKSNHKDLEALKKALKPVSEWDIFKVEESESVSGWLSKPKPTTDFARWRDNNQAITIADALAMAREGYGWFVTKNAGAKPPQSDLYCAIENGYLPPNFPTVSLDSPIDAAHFKALMLMACSGRNIITAEAKNLPLCEGSITGKNAVTYALKLEQLINLSFV